MLILERFVSEVFGSNLAKSTVKLKKKFDCQVHLYKQKKLYCAPVYPPRGVNKHYFV
jgi:hypothetical protein